MERKESPMTRPTRRTFALFAVLAGCGRSAPAQEPTTASAPLVSATVPQGSARAATTSEQWQSEQGPVLVTAEAKGFLVARCPSGTCEATRTISGGKQLSLSAEETSRGIGAGILACKKMGKKLLTLRSPKNDEETFCEFADRSLLSTNALEACCVR
jgi:hypothetical protein